MKYIQFYYPYSLLPTPYSLLPTPYSLPFKGMFFTKTSGVGCGAWGDRVWGYRQAMQLRNRGFPPLAIASRQYT
ncbi:MAG: hypothetical protein F6J90_04890 [Moorea sp. SIOASIH]|uniref:hypothetical protein n=1 Tax=Moorena sp. SIOASIH TaxID=2607817 RepID=UPI0013BA2B4B|nr:hypothetical protein [Moorena sp. SIOASIH]NEO35692.1 hypothetical protein [Moorena sp. SIOASIH]